MREALKLFIKNNAFKMRQKTALKRLQKIMDASKDVKIVKKDDGKKILFNLIYGMYGKIIFWECALAKSLQIRGHDVKALVCGTAFNMCTTEYTIQTVHDETTCRHCNNFSRKFLETIEMPYSIYKEYISEEGTKKIEKTVEKLSIEECKKHKYKDIDVGTLSTNAAMRYFKGSLNPNPEEYDRVLRSELINSIIAIEVAEKVLEKEKPDVLVTRHLGYSSWGSFAEYFIKKGIRVCSPGEGYSPTTLYFDMDDVENDFNKYFKEIRQEQVLDESSEKELDEFIARRFKGKEGDTIDYEFTQHETPSGMFDFDKFKKTYAIFPNVPWDSSLLNANKSFKDVYEWVSHTIKLFEEKPDHQLIIKIHPSELYVMKSEHTVLDFINEEFPELPENIKILPPDTSLSPYALFPHIEKGIVYNGTIGLEMILNKIPVVVAGVTHYGEKGFTFDAETKDDYDNLIFSKMTITPKQQALSKVYAYFYFLKSFIPYDYVRSNVKTLDFGWKIKALEEFKEGNDRYLDHICNYILGNNVYQDW
jgi:hypothetical protein